MNSDQVNRYRDLFHQHLKGGAQLSVEEFLKEHDLPRDDRLIPELEKLERELGKGPYSPTAPPPEHEPVDVNRPTVSMPVEAVGSSIGDYKLLQKIGEGGMGVVYMAEQTQPVKRRVAVKVIKPGMDSKEVLARFEAERQALALMDHPHIAGVLEAGTTGAGRPYFVMELVKGIPITRYCDEKHLTPKERIELFVPICHAVQHAHQKGIIHRDIKPSNILVAEYDNRPVPKIIDFGVAKAIGQQLTEKTMFTQYGQIVGTIDYMSPEQASFNQLDVDTRSDIYSLGVLLYELLAGETPFDKQRLRAAAIEELLRIIRQEEPPCPSIRLSSHANLPSIAANRKIEPERLSVLVRGDLDWIVMKAMDKERNRRYQTASGFAEEIARYLQHEPVQACPPSPGYRFRKFARRNRGLLASAATVLTALVLGLVGTSWGLVRALAAESEAREAQHIAEVETQRTIKNVEILHFQVNKLSAFEDITCPSMNNLAARIDHAAELNTPESRALHNELLERMLEFWDGVIEVEIDRSGNPGNGRPYYGLQRAICLARTGEHEQAFDDTQALRSNADRMDRYTDDLIRICGICAAAALREDNQGLAADYIEVGIQFMRYAADLGGFAPPSTDDPDLAPLGTHEEFDLILDDWNERWSQQGHEQANLSKRANSRLVTQFQSGGRR